MSKPKMTKLILIGQAPAQKGNPRAVLEGRLGERIAELFGISNWWYVQNTQRFNILPKWMGKSGKGDLFPMPLARQNARRMRYSLGGCRVLFIGIQVAAAFDVTHKPLRWKNYPIAADHNESFRCAILPHPSGVNHWWNDICNRADAADFMRRAWRISHG